MIVINAQLESFRSLKDKTLKLSFETQEVTPEQMSQIGLHNQMYGFLVFDGKQISDDQLQAIENASNDLLDNKKTPSKRLRNTMYVWWQQDPQSFTRFEDFYLHQMERIITNVKSKLEPA